jgi:hypothetical protein
MDRLLGWCRGGLFVAECETEEGVLQGCTMTEPHDEDRSYPADWPASCPPQDASPASGEVYRVVKNNPPEETDFHSHREKGLLPSAPECMRCGLSVFDELHGATHMLDLFPKLGKYVATASLQDCHGKVKRTPGKHPSHTTWWPYSHVRRDALFSVGKETG